MHWITALRPRADSGLLLVARTSQALTIASADMVLAAGAKSHLVPVAMLRRLSSELAGLLVADPGAFVDDLYDLTQRLFELHREFAQRLIEVLDGRLDAGANTADGEAALVLPFPARAGERRATH